MERARAFRRTTFSSLAVRNYRLYAIGQAISLSGTWMQTVAQGLLVLGITGSGAQLGFVTAVQMLPILLFAPIGGLLADRCSKRRILYVTQVLAGVNAILLGLLASTDDVRMWMVYALAFAFGMVNAVDNPTRQSFVVEMVGRDNLANAISLNATEINLARVIGPSLAGIFAATLGLPACFIINGLSYLPVIYVLSRMRETELQPAPRVVASRGQLSDGLRYVMRSPTLFATLLMMAIVGTFTYEFRISLPMLSEFTFNQGETGYAAMTAVMGVGAMVGGIVAASRRAVGPSSVVLAALLFGASVLATAVSPSMPIALAILIVVGYFSVTFTSMGNVTMQLNSAPEMRGRIMALWTMASLGSTPIGGPIIGAIGEYAGPRWGLVVGGIAGMAAAAIGARLIARERRQTSLLLSTRGASD